MYQSYQSLDENVEFCLNEVSNDLSLIYLWVSPHKACKLFGCQNSREFRKLFYVMGLSCIWIAFDNCHIWNCLTLLPREGYECDLASCFYRHMCYRKKGTYEVLFLNGTAYDSSNGLSDWIFCRKQHKWSCGNFHVSNYDLSVRDSSWATFHMFYIGTFQIFRGQILYGTVKIFPMTEFSDTVGRILLFSGWLSFDGLAYGSRD